MLGESKEKDLILVNKFWKYICNVIESSIKSFKKHFSHLLDLKNQCPIKTKSLTNCPAYLSFKILTTYSSLAEAQPH